MLGSLQTSLEGWKDGDKQSEKTSREQEWAREKLTISDLELVISGALG